MRGDALALIEGLGVSVLVSVDDNEVRCVTEGEAERDRVLDDVPLMVPVLDPVALIVGLILNDPGLDVGDPVGLIVAVVLLVGVMLGVPMYAAAYALKFVATWLAVSTPSWIRNCARANAPTLPASVHVPMVGLVLRTDTAPR